ncbi:MAG TPA: hypothetical protein VGC41_24000 [Kofleriaceae bacterium]
MPDWYLSLRGTAAHTLAEYTGAVTAAFGPVTVTSGELNGNPRDFYSREHVIAADHTVVVAVLENTRGEGDPEASFSPSAKILADASFRDRMTAWSALVAALAPLGLTDDTLASPTVAEMVEDALAEGFMATAEDLRQRSTTAMVQAAPNAEYVSLVRTAADPEAVLAACDPAIVTSLSIGAAQFPTLPRGLERFAKLDMLDLHAYQHDVLRGFALPTVTRLSFAWCAIDRLLAEDVAAVPNLTTLILSSTKIGTLDRAIAARCPRLAVIYIYDTPLAKRPDEIAALLAAWPNLAFQYDGRR